MQSLSKMHCELYHTKFHISAVGFCLSWWFTDTTKWRRLNFMQTDKQQVNKTLSISSMPFRHRFAALVLYHHIFLFHQFTSPSKSLPAHLLEALMHWSTRTPINAEPCRTELNLPSQQLQYFTVRRCCRAWKLKFSKHAVVSPPVPSLFTQKAKLRAEKILKEVLGLYRKNCKKQVIQE